MTTRRATVSMKEEGISSRNNAAPVGDVGEKRQQLSSSSFRELLAPRRTRRSIIIKKFIISITMLPVLVRVFNISTGDQFGGDDDVNTSHYLVSGDGKPLLNVTMTPPTTTTTTTTTTTKNNAPQKNPSSSSSSSLLFHDSSESKSKSKNNDNIQVFIGIKTMANHQHNNNNKQHHWGGQRLFQIQTTWLHDVVKRQNEIDLKFFASSDDLKVFSSSSTSSYQNISSSTTTSTAAAVDGGGGFGDDTSSDSNGVINFNDQTSIDNWFIQTPSKCEQHCCKGEMMFRYFYDKYINNVNNNSNNKKNNNDPYSPWFCSFDDDNYVLIDNLLKVLKSYAYSPKTNSSTHVTNNNNQKKQMMIFIGRPSLNGIRQPYKASNGKKKFRKVNFLTGGAGYCLSNKLMRYGYDHGRRNDAAGSSSSSSSSVMGSATTKTTIDDHPNNHYLNGFFNFTKYCTTNRLPDDVALGLFVNTELGIKQTFHPKFHSHLETNLRQSLPIEEISKQVSFGYDNKIDYHMKDKFGNANKDAFPNINILYKPEDDPMLFRSLRKFLLG